MVQPVLHQIKLHRYLPQLNLPILCIFLYVLNILSHKRMLSFLKCILLFVSTCVFTFIFRRLMDFIYLLQIMGMLLQKRFQPIVCYHSFKCWFSNSIRNIIFSTRSSDFFHYYQLFFMPLSKTRCSYMSSSAFVALELHIFCCSSDILVVYELVCIFLLFLLS